MSCGIYCIENLINGSKYIGKSTRFEERIKDHINKLRGNRHTNSYIQQDWNEQEENSFIFYMIEELENIKELLINMEIYWTVYFDSVRKNNIGYNVTYGGDGLLGFTFTEESKKKMSDSAKGNSSHKGFIHSEEVRKKMGRHRTEEQRIEDSKKRQGKKPPNSSSIYVGVRWDKSRNLWMAGIVFLRKSITIGRYKNEIDAAKAYNSKAIELFGSDARINKIEENK